MSYCSNCGAELQANDRFCRQCGGETSAVVPTVETAFGTTPAIGDAVGRPPLTADALGPGELADWASRLGGFLIDALVLFAVLVPFYLLGLAAPAFVYLGVLASLAGAVYFGAQIGEGGQSPGMRVVGLRCVHKGTGQPIGSGLGVVRMIASNLNSIVCYIGWLFPLWDAKRQTLADKVMTTIVVRVPKQRFTIAPPR